MTGRWPGHSRICAARTRFARRRWRGRMGRWRALLVTGAVVAVAGGAGWLVLGSEALDVDAVAVQGTRLLSPAEVERAAEVPPGAPLARLDLDAVRARVENLLAVESVAVTRDWPGTVRVVVTERQAVAVVESDGARRGLDAEGVLFRGYRSPPEGLPLVRSDDLAAALSDDGASTADALREVALVVESLPPSVSRRVDHVDVASLDSIALVLGDGSRVRWGSAEDSALKADVLATLMSVDASTYDVSVPGLPTTSG